MNNNTFVTWLQVLHFASQNDRDSAFRQLQGFFNKHNWEFHEGNCVSSNGKFFISSVVHNSFTQQVEQDVLMQYDLSALVWFGLVWLKITVMAQGCLHMCSHLLGSHKGNFFSVQTLRIKNGPNVCCVYHNHFSF